MWKKELFKRDSNTQCTLMRQVLNFSPLLTLCYAQGDCGPQNGFCKTMEKQHSLSALLAGSARSAQTSTDKVELVGSVDLGF